MSPRLPLVLGSASPRRTQLLDSLGIPHEVVVAGVVEPSPGSLPPHELVAAAARLKARAVSASRPGRLVLGADTVVVLGEPNTSGEVLGKPSGPAEGREMLQRLSGRAHCVLTCVVLVRDGREAQATATTEVRFAELEPAFIERYLATGEPLDKAGAYGAQGLMGSQVRSIEGSWTNVVGLPLELLPALFAEIGENLADWQDW